MLPDTLIVGFTRTLTILGYTVVAVYARYVWHRVDKQGVKLAARLIGMSSAVWAAFYIFLTIQAGWGSTAATWIVLGSRLAHIVMFGALLTVLKVMLDDARKTLDPKEVARRMRDAMSDGEMGEVGA